MPVPVRKAILPVGGLGTRFLPATKSLPKEMLPVVDKPLIQYAFEEGRAAGIEQFIFVTGRGKQAIEDHFDHAVELQDTLAGRGKSTALQLVRDSVPVPGQVCYTRQQDPLGLGHAVWCARHFIGDEPVAIILPDDLIIGEPGCLAQMVEAYRETGGTMIAAMEVPAEQVSSYGIITPGRTRDRLVEVRGLVEKPSAGTAPSRLAVIGRYIVQASLFAHLEGQEPGAGGEIQITDALAREIGAGPFNALLFEGRRFDCGDRTGWLEANIACALRREDMRPAVSALLASYG